MAFLTQRSQNMHFFAKKVRDTNLDTNNKETRNINIIIVFEISLSNHLNGRMILWVVFSGSPE